MYMEKLLMVSIYVMQPRIQSLSTPTTGFQEESYKIVVLGARKSIGSRLAGVSFLSAV
jgi:hypothetical protein